MKSILEATEAGLGNGETPIFPIQIFKVREGTNYNPGDPNYDLFKLACKVSAKRLFPNFSFLDVPFNSQFYKEGRLPVDKLVKFYPFEKIEEAFEDSHKGVTIKPILTF